MYFNFKSSEMNITEQSSITAYKHARRFAKGELSFTEAVDQLVEIEKINRNSAVGLINNLRCMVEGKRYTWTSNLFTTNHYLSNIYNDFGVKGLKNALMSLDEHIEYYEEKRGRSLPGIRELRKKHFESLHSVIDDGEQDEITNKIFNDRVRHDAIVEKLKNLKNTDNEFITINNRVYKRDNYTVALIKVLRKFECQICSTSIKKKNGYYIEAAHITPKRLEGRETPDNILILCPNHHKEFDFDNTEIVSRTSDYVSFIMNGVVYEISLKIV